MNARLASLALILSALGACDEPTPPAPPGPGGAKPVRVAYVTNMVDPFWNVAKAGAEAAAKELGVTLNVQMPPKSVVAEQKRIVEGVLARGVDGIAISPVDAANMTGFLDEIAAKTHLITHDSDAPASKRLCFVGMNNYAAGRQAGQLVKEALPDGGKVAIFVGRMEQLNAQQRRQGVIDELLDRPAQNIDALKIDPVDAELKGARYAVVRTMTDTGDYAKAKANAEDAITSAPDLACLVGLFAYNGPMCLEGVRSQGKIGKLKVVCFDEQDATLEAIKAGEIHGTVSQQPYYYGYHSVRILAALARGDRSVLPKGGVLDVESQVVRKDNVEKFWADLKKLRGN
jgi:ribose transport system substrate-binding protein